MRLRIFLPAIATLALLFGCSIEFNSNLGGTGHGIDPIAVNDDNFVDVVLASDKPVLVDFSTDWCGYCEEMEPTVAEVAAEFEGRALVCRIDADESPLVANRYQVKYFPTFMFFKNGQVAQTFTGTQAKSSLADQLDSMIEIGAE